MDKNEVLLFSVLLESDMFAGGYGTTEEDARLLHGALKKIYNVADDTPDEELKSADKQMYEDIKNLVIEMREKFKQYLVAEYPELVNS